MPHTTVHCCVFLRQLFLNDTMNSMFYFIWIGLQTKKLLDLGLFLHRIQSRYNSNKRAYTENYNKKYPCKL